MVYDERADSRTEIVVETADRPGLLALIGEALGESEVNILAAVAVAANGKAIVRLVVDDAGTAVLALKRSDIAVSETRDVLVVTLEDRPGELGRWARSLADRGININALYIAGERLGEKELIVALDKPQSRGP